MHRAGLPLQGGRSVTMNHPVAGWRSCRAPKQPIRIYGQQLAWQLYASLPRQLYGSRHIVCVTGTIKLPQRQVYASTLPYFLTNPVRNGTPVDLPARPSSASKPGRSTVSAVYPLSLTLPHVCHWTGSFMLRFSQNGSFMVPASHVWNHKVAAFRAAWNHRGSIKLPQVLGPKLARSIVRPAPEHRV